MPHLGINIYCWEEERQNRLLAESLQPAVSELETQTGSLRFWFDRFDARGPHLFVLLTHPPEATRTVQDFLASRLDSFLAANPSAGRIGADQVRRRHQAACRLALCAVDREPGIEPEDVCRFFQHPPHAFPFHLSKHLPEAMENRLWELAHHLSLWSAHQISARHGRLTRAAVTWLSAFASVLENRGLEAESFWRSYAASLLPHLSAALAGDERRVLRGLPRMIGEKNVQGFSPFWSQAGPAQDPWPPVAELVERLFHPNPAGQPWRLPREIVHSLLKQLCVPVAREIPLILYAWWRSLPERERR